MWSRVVVTEKKNAALLVYYQEHPVSGFWSLKGFLLDNNRGHVCLRIVVNAHVFEQKNVSLQGYAEVSF